MINVIERHLFVYVYISYILTGIIKIYVSVTKVGGGLVTP